MVKQKISKKNRYVLFLLASIFCLALVMLVLEKKGIINLYTKDTKTELVDTETIDYSPPSDEEMQAGDDQKDKILKEEETRNNPGDQQRQNANVMITDAGQYDNVIEVRAFIPDYYQDGTCTITFTKDSHTVSKQTPAYRDVSTTICTNPNFNHSEFPSKGNWQLVVTYTSAGAQGSSTPQTVNIK